MTKKIIMRSTRPWIGTRPATGGEMTFQPDVIYEMEDEDADALLGAVMTGRRFEEPAAELDESEEETSEPEANESEGEAAEPDASETTEDDASETNLFQRSTRKRRR